MFVNSTTHPTYSKGYFVAKKLLNDSFTENFFVIPSDLYFILYVTNVKEKNNKSKSLLM